MEPARALGQLLALPRPVPCEEAARERGVSTAQVGLAWLLHKPGVTAPIVGTTKVEHLEDALAAAELELGGDELERLEEPYVPHAVSGH